VDLTLLLDSGVDLHSYQPTVDDILTISNCDVFIYVGGESDAWVTDALSQAANEDMQVIRLMDVLKDSVKEEELVEGMQAGDDNESDGDGEESAEETPEYDEHVWLSLKNAKILTDAIAQALEEADPDNAEAYSENAQAYMDKLTALDEEYQKAALAGERDTILFADRFPFRYLTDDYDLNYYAAFAGCSAETEASFETILFLAEKADELELPVILTIDGSDQTIAEAVINSTNAKDQKILSMNSMQSITAGDMEDGASYLSVMEENLEVLKEALS
jgi:zinc transport system substrate-binding protein